MKELMKRLTLSSFPYRGRWRAYIWRSPLMILVNTRALTGTVHDADVKFESL